MKKYFLLHGGEQVLLKWLKKKEWINIKIRMETSEKQNTSVWSSVPLDKTKLY